MTETIKSDIRRLSKEALETLMKENNFPRYRADQIWEWVWTKQRVTFDQFKNLPKELIAFLDTNFTILPVTIDKVQKSIDGTIKSRMKLFDDHLVESVLIPVRNDKRFTVCVSSQVGCSLSCTFCATGQMKRMRNLDASEIYDQVALVNKQCLETYKHPLTNIVYMGMGEPLLNYANVLQSIACLLYTSPSPRDATLSRMPSSA